MGNADKIELVKLCVLRLIAEGKVTAEYVSDSLSKNRPLDGFYGEDDKLVYIDKENSAAGARLALESLN